MPDVALPSIPQKWHHEKSHFREEGATLKRTRDIPWYLRIERKSRVSLYQQLCGQLRKAIMRGYVRAGFELPATRDLARFLGLSRTTIMNAYETLRFEGLIVGVRGSCTRVAGEKPRRISKPLIASKILREAHFPTQAAGFADPEGNIVYVYR